jgi:hypothetical protein
MYRPADYPELNGKEPEWVQAERDMFKGLRIIKFAIPTFQNIATKTVMVN